MALCRYSSNNNNNNNVHYNRYNSLNQYYSSVDPYVSSTCKSNLWRVLKRVCRSDMWTRVMEGAGPITAATTATRNQLISTYLTATTRGITGMKKAPCRMPRLCFISIPSFHSSRFAGYFQSRPGTSYASTQGSNSYNGNSWQVRFFCAC